MTDWALAVVGPNAENAASRELVRYSYPHIWFKKRTQRVWRGRVCEVLQPAFPRYLWVPFETAWDVLRDVSRVLALVSFGEGLERVPGHVVEQLIARCGGGDVLPPEAVPARFRQGDRVLIKGANPLAGQIAIYEYPITHGRALAQILWLGAWRPVALDEADLEMFENKKKKRRRNRPRKKLRHRPCESPTVLPT